MLSEGEESENGRGGGRNRVQGIRVIRLSLIKNARKVIGSRCRRRKDQESVSLSLYAPIKDENEMEIRSEMLIKFVIFRRIFQL